MHPNRPRQLIGVLGTHTEVGKTYVTSRWLAALRQQGFKANVRKPVQSFNAADLTTDAKQLAAATGEALTAVCPPHRCYPLAYAPPMAAEILGYPRIQLDDLVKELNWQEHCEIGVVETVGGPRSPIAHDGDSVELLLRLQPDRVLLVADAGLGTLNAVRMSLAAIAPLNGVVFLNRYRESDELHRLNRAWLADAYGIEALIDLPALTACLTKTHEATGYRPQASAR